MKEREDDNQGCILFLVLALIFWVLSEIIFSIVKNS